MKDFAHTVNCRAFYKTDNLMRSTIAIALHNICAKISGDAKNTVLITSL